MSTLALVIDTSSLRRTSLGSISGIIYAHLDGVSFPETNWTDLIVLVLVEWLDTISKLSRGDSWTERFHFLDGPFALDLTLTQDGVLQVASIARRLSGDVVMDECQADLDTVVTNARLVADDLLRECARLGWTNPTVEALAEARREMDARRRSSA